MGSNVAVLVAAGRAHALAALAAGAQPEALRAQARLSVLDAHLSAAQRSWVAGVEQGLRDDQVAQHVAQVRASEAQGLSVEALSALVEGLRAL